MGLHFISTYVILFIVVGVIALQCMVYMELKGLYQELRYLMMVNTNVEDWDELRGCNAKNTIIRQIDQYLGANKGAAPNFDIVKDIVARKADELDERVRSLQPIPLYYGLGGTIIGIIVGLGAIVLSDSGDLLDNVSSLLTGVAIAMVGSLAGVVITSLAATEHKRVIQAVESGKSRFFHWFQIRMLPVLGKDPSGPIGQLIQSLANFNEDFAHSAGIMSATAQDMANTFAIQKDLVVSTQTLLESNLASKNVAMAQQLTQHIDVVRSFNSSIVGMQSYVDTLCQVT